MSNVKLLKGNNIELLRELEDNSVDSIVTDPPYGLSAAPNSGKKSKGGFMGKKWDYDVPTVELWEECLRVLKPGGHLLAFSGTRTYHRMVVRIEDAGFEIRDMISWVYGSGFPKSMDISKQIDKKLGAEREIVGENPSYRKLQNNPSNYNLKRNPHITSPSTDLAKQWSGWGTALKPAVEPVVMARKPIEESTVAENVLKYGTGGINIDESRIGTHEVITTDSRNSKSEHFGQIQKHETYQSNGQELGRWPANFIHDGSDEVEEIFPASNGSGPARTITRNARPEQVGWGMNSKTTDVVNMPDAGSGSASRFFYCPKVSKRERNEGLLGFEDVIIDSNDFKNLPGMRNNSINTSSGKLRNVLPTKNHHPTVKPTDLMLYLIRLVTPKGGITLDPFMGSGSTGKAAVRGGFGFIGMELEEDYFDIAEARIKWESDKPKTETTSKTKKDDVLTNPETIETLNKFFGE